MPPCLCALHASPCPLLTHSRPHGLSSRTTLTKRSKSGECADSSTSMPASSSPPSPLVSRRLMKENEIEKPKEPSVVEKVKLYLIVRSDMTRPRLDPCVTRSLFHRLCFTSLHLSRDVLRSTALSYYSPRSS